MSLFDLVSDPTFQRVCLGTSMIGAISGAIGCFAYLRKQSLVGDVVAHSSLFGVVLFFLGNYLLFGQSSKSLFVLVPGAIFSGVLALWVNQWFLRTTKVRVDSSLGVMLAIFFGSGVFLLRWIQRSTPPIRGHRGLEGYFFGQAAAITTNDLVMIFTMGVVSILLVVLFFKELKIFTLDPVFSKNMGLPTRWLELLMVVLIVIGVVIGIQSIGVILMIAMLVTPPAAARQWVSSLQAMMWVSALIGVVSGGIGCLISASLDKMPTGPIIILVCIGLFLVSLFFAPHRGLVSDWIAKRRFKGRSFGGHFE
ncbi:MAG: iron chelate uptake ABC transporter family permease subunit [Planctomycetota bacterium]